MKIAILDDYQNAALGAADWSALGDDVEITVFDIHLGHDLGPVAEALAPFEVLVAMRERTPFPAALLGRLDKLRFLVTTGMRNAAIDMAAAKARGVVVCGTGMLGFPAAEHAMALILDLFKKISRENKLMHEGGWQGSVSEGLGGRTLALLGLGKLGERVARFGLALDMKVIAWSENLSATRAAEVGVRLVDRQTLFAEADVLSIHLVLSQRSRGLVGAEDLARMKPSAYLVNTSRGPIVDEAALIGALQNGAIAGAGLDVYDVEPLPTGHVFRAMENVVLTGHTGYVVAELYAKAYGEAVENIAAWRNGAPVRVLND